MWQQKYNLLKKKQEQVQLENSVVLLLSLINTKTQQKTELKSLVFRDVGEQQRGPGFSPWVFSGFLPQSKTLHVRKPWGPGLPWERNL